MGEVTRFVPTMRFGSSDPYEVALTPREDPPEVPPIAGVVADDEALWKLFSQSRNGMLIADDDRRYVNANPAALALLGYELATFRTMRIDDITIPEYRPFLDDIWADFLARGGTVGRFAVLRSDGTPVEIEFNATANVAPGLHMTIFINPQVTGDAAGLDDDDVPDKNFDEPVPAVARRSGRMLDGDERRVVTLLALGHSWHEVADDMGTDAASVRELMMSAMATLGARTRAHAVSIALRAGEIDPADLTEGPA